MMSRHPERFPLLLTFSRGVLGPCIIACAYLWPRPAVLASCVIMAFLTDIFDGVLARRLNVATPNIRRLDSIADNIFYLCALWAVWVLHPNIILDNALPLVLLAVLECTRYAFDLRKFGREASYHMWSSKLWGITLFIAFIMVFTSENPGFLPMLTIAVGVISDVEGLLISLTLRSWRYDVPSIVHALRIRANQHTI